MQSNIKISIILFKYLEYYKYNKYIQNIIDIQNILNNLNISNKMVPHNKNSKETLKTANTYRKQGFDFCVHFRIRMVDHKSYDPIQTYLCQNIFLLREVLFICSCLSTTKSIYLSLSHY